MAMPRRRSSGLALLAVLVFVALAAAAVIALVDRSAVALSVEARARRQDRLLHKAEAVMEKTRAMLAEADQQLQGLHHPAEGWGKLPAAESEGDGESAVDVSDESGRISLEMLDARLAERVFAEAGLTPTEVARAVEQWTEFRAKRPAGAGTRFAPSWGALLELPGFALLRTPDPKAQANRLADLQEYLSLEGFTRCNVNAAEARVLRLLGLPDSEINRLLGRVAEEVERGAGVKALEMGPGLNAPEQLAVTAQCLVLRVVVRERTAEAVGLTTVLRLAQPQSGTGNAQNQQALAAVAEEIRRRRAMRVASRTSTQTPVPGTPTAGVTPGAPTQGAVPRTGPESGNYQLIAAEESFIEPTF